jgi:hypothetical protein
MFDYKNPDKRGHDPDRPFYFAWLRNENGGSVVLTDGAATLLSMLTAGVLCGDAYIDAVQLAGGVPPSDPPRMPARSGGRLTEGRRREARGA